MTGEYTTGSASGNFYYNLKRVYGKGIVYDILKNSALLDELTNNGADDVDLRGESFYWDVYLQRSGAAGFVGENENLPAYSTSTQRQASAIVKECWGRQALTERAMALSKGGEKGAFISAMDLAANGITEELKFNVNRSLYGNRVSNSVFNTGILGTLAATANSATQVISNCGSPNSFYPGMKLRIGTLQSAADDTTHIQVGGTNEAYGVVRSVSVNQSTGAVSITFTAAINGTAGWYLVQGDDGSTGWSAFDRELTGLDHIIQDHDDNLYSIDTGDFPKWKGVLMGSSASPTTLSRARMDAFASAMSSVTGEVPTSFIGHSATVRAVYGTIDGDVLYQPFKSDGGFDRSAVTWHCKSTNVPILEDDMAKPGTLYAINKKFLSLAFARDWGWMEADGSRYFRVSNHAAYEMVFGAMMELVCKRRNTQGRLDGIKTDNVIYVAA